MKKKFLCGIDEAGRGPLAGPVAVGVVCAPQEYDFSRYLALGLRDSKQMTERARERVFETLSSDGALTYVVAMRNVAEIDRIGIVPSIRQALEVGLAELAVPEDDVRLLLDGGLVAPPYFKDQTSIIHGDQLEPVISLAAVAAKVTRDRHMFALDTQFPAYGFASHKGYGTRAHYAAIAMHGLSPEHRRTFCRRVRQVIGY